MLNLFLEDKDMDIRIDEKDGKFKFRVCGIVHHDDKYLVVRMDSNPFYCLPGGHVELDEDTDTAVLREMKEELGFDVKIKQLIAVNQNFFKTKDGKPFHEIGFYYIVEAKNESDLTYHDYEREEIDKGELKHHEFRWLTKEELSNISFKPTFIIQNLENKAPVINITRDPK